MGGEDEDDKDSEDEDEKQKLTGDAAQEAKQLDSLTDFVEDKETSKVDTKEVEARLKDLRVKKEESDRQRAEREKQLASVKIKQEDLDLMCDELPLCERAALERLLREQAGDLVKALGAAVRKFPTNS
mmetsp:Transcript_48849/g.98532  ORF Transcript_48849/g.98532 Transcript_48849/m.98532 type:complete len:128 (-) Transcript_48849:114-497(-)